MHRLTTDMAAGNRVPMLSVLVVGSFALLIGPALVLRWLNGVDERFAGDLVLLSAFVVTNLVGALIAFRRPREPVGWLLSLSAHMVVVAFLADQYARYGIITAPGSVPGAHAIYWFATWPWIGSLGGIVFAALLFPDGRLPSARWRPFSWITAALMTLTATVLAFAPPVAPSHPELLNPLGIEAFSGAALLFESTPGFLMFLVLLGGSVLSLIVRFRRSRGVERQQLKWVASAVALALLGFALGDALPDGILADIAFGIALVALPLAIGVAMLRHRLYDIDVLINRTVVYAVLSGMLLGTYVLLVLALGALFRPLTGSSDLTVAGSTLAVVALFQPLRSWIQRQVDRRFYRARYDAARTVEQFSTRLREQVDLDQLRGELIAVIEDTVKPAHASLWLR